MKTDWNTPPEDLDDAVNAVIAGIDTAEDRAALTRGSAYLHFGFGMYMRNQWKLWAQDTPLVQWFGNTHNIRHADDISSIVLDSVAAALKGEAFDVPAAVAQCHAHWEKWGMEPNGMRRANE